MKKLLIGLLLIQVLPACSSLKRNTRTLPEISISARDPKTITRESAPRLWDIMHVRAALSFNWPERTAEGSAWIDVKPYFYPQDTIVLDAKSMQIDSVGIINNSKLSPLPYTYRDDKLSIATGKKYTSSETLRLYIKYKAMPYAIGPGGSAAIGDDRGLYFINTDGAIAGKLQQIWTQGETESNSHWLPSIDKPNERFTVQLELTVPDTMQTLSNGLKISSEPAGKGLRTDTWSMDMPIQTYAIMFAIGRYSIVKDSWRGKEVSYYVEPEYAPYARKMFMHTPEMMEYFSSVTGVSYPWQKYAQVVARDYVSGAMENTSATLFGEFMNQNFREIADKNYEDIVSHELFHQWFGDYVTQESWSHLTLSESFATYGEQLWRRHWYGPASADELWYNDLHIYLESNNHTSPLLRYHYSDKEDMFDRISYQKGAAILRYLHALLGDEAFYKAMDIYLTKNALSSAEVVQWRLAVEEASGLDWSWFFRQFYERGGHPMLDVGYQYDDERKELVVTVLQGPADSSFVYRLPLKTAVFYGAEREDKDWLLTGKSEVFRYPYRNGVKPLVVPDIGHWLPGSLNENKKPEDWLRQIKTVNDYISKRLAIDAAVKKTGTEAALQVIDLALSDTSAGISAYALEQIEDLTQESFALRWKDRVVNLASSGPIDVRSEALNMAGKWKLRSAKDIMLKAVSDTSYRVAGAALNALRQLDPDTALIISRSILQQDPKAELERAAELSVAIKGQGADLVYFEQKAPYVYGGRKLNFVSTFVAFLVLTKDMPAFDKGLEILGNMARKENIKSYRRAIVLSILYAAPDAGKKGLENDLKRNKVKRLLNDLISSEPEADNKAEFQRAYIQAFGNAK